MLNILSCTVGGANMGASNLIIIPSITVALINVIKIGIPIILIFLGMLDLGKAVMSNEEKEMKTAQSRLIKRVVYAILVFLIVAIVQLVVGVLSSSDTSGSVDGTSINSCISCFVNSTSYCK